MSCTNPRSAFLDVLSTDNLVLLDICNLGQSPDLLYNRLRETTSISVNGTIVDMLDPSKVVTDQWVRAMSIL